MAKITTTSNAALDLEPDGTGDINLTPGTNGDVNIPANKGITFGDDAEKIEGDGTDLTVSSSNDLNLTATTDINIPQNVGLTFGDDGEKIEGNATKLDIAAAEIDFSIEAGGDINIGTDIGLTFGDDGEKIEGDGTDLTVSSSGNFTVDATGDIILDAGGADVTLKDGGTTFGSLKQASGHLVIQPTSSKEIILNDQAGTASLTVDTSSQNVSINNGNLVMGSAGKGIDFSGAQTAIGGTTNEVLSGYEEGVFNPAFVSGGGTVTINPLYNLMSYTKIGRLVHIQGYISVESVSSPTTSLSLTGLPFNVRAHTGAKYDGHSAASFGLIYNLSSDVHMILGRFAAGGSTMAFQGFDGTTQTATVASAMQASTWIVISGSYET